MNTSNKKIIKITSIQFESNEPEVLVKGCIKHGNMSYPTDILISQTQLNIIINQIKKKNPAFDFSETLTVETMYNNEKMFTANLSNSHYTTFDLDELFAPKTYIQIRA